MAETRQCSPNVPCLPLLFQAFLAVKLGHMTSFDQWIVSRCDIRGFLANVIKNKFASSSPLSSLMESWRPCVPEAAAARWRVYVNIR